MPLFPKSYWLISITDNKDSTLECSTEMQA